MIQFVSHADALLWLKDAAQGPCTLIICGGCRECWPPSGHGTWAISSNAKGLVHWEEEDVNFYLPYDKAHRWVTFSLAETPANLAIALQSGIDLRGEDFRLVYQFLSNKIAA